jgi:hypothetical protein
MTAICSFCAQETDANLLAVSSKTLGARICDKCLFRELEKLFSQEANLPSALDRLGKEQRTVLTHVTAAVETRVQTINSSTLALDSELAALRDMKRQLQDTLHQHGAGVGANGEALPHGTSQRSDIRTSAVKRLVEERMNPGTIRAREAAAAATDGA